MSGYISNTKFGYNSDEIENYQAEMLKIRMNVINSGTTVKLMNYDSNLINCEEDIKQMLDSVKRSTRSVSNGIYDYMNDVAKSYTIAKETNNIIESEKNSLPSVSDVSLSSSGYVSSGASYVSYSTSGSSEVGMSSSGGSSSSSEVAIGEKSSSNRNVNEVDVETIVLDLLAPFGLTKEQFSGLRKASEGDDYSYAVILNNTNKDGKWNPTDIKEYYVKDGKVIGALTGDETYVKVEDDKLVLDDAKSNDFSKVVMSGVGMAGSFFAAKTGYNNVSTRAIFETVYPNASDDEYNNFVESINKNGEKYENAAKNVIENYKDEFLSNSNDSTNGTLGNNNVPSSAVDEEGTTTGDVYNNVKSTVEGTVESASEKIEQFNIKDHLVIEDNAIKVNAKNLAAELYANVSKLNNIDFSDGISTEVIFNEATADKLATYLNTKYSMNVDASTLMGTAKNVASSVSNGGLSTSSATTDSAV